MTNGEVVELVIGTRRDVGLEEIEPRASAFF
jgi:hypothetical protein